VATKTLTQLRSSVRTLYGDADGVTATDAEVDLWLQDGVDRVLAECPWINVVLDSSEALTTDAVGAAYFPTHSIQQVYSVEVLKSDGVTYNRLVNVHAGRLNWQNWSTTNKDEIVGYYMDGTRIEFFPKYLSLSLTVRLVYASDSIGAAFPTVAGNTLPAYFPRLGEEAAIRHAVSRLHARDNNFEAANFIDSDVNNYLMRLRISHNRPERGETISLYNRDEYVLDAGSGAD
jgi:hypothetical protein